ncbi:MAG: ABC transporter substrate-binding protein [Limnochordia bacterium]|jgi:ABC-type glycerol-3-phosphate transport system substrate-binding protein
MGKRLLTLFIVVGLVAVFAVGTVMAKKITLSYAHWSDEPGRKELFEDAFNQSQDEIEVTFRNFGFGSYGHGYVEKLTVEMAAGTGPDIFSLMLWPNAPLPTYLWAKNGLLLDLTPYLERERRELQVDEWYPFVLDRCRFAGRVVGLPYAWTIFGTLVYHTELFENEGLAFPNESWTWDDLANTSRKLLKLDSDGRVVRWGLSAQPSYSFANWRQMDAMIVAAGGSMYDARQSSLALRTDPAMRVMNHVLEGVRSNAYQMGEPSWTGNAVGILLWQLHMAAEYGTKMRVGQLPPVALELAVSPKDPVTLQRQNHSEIAAVGINANTPNPEAAWKVLKFVNLNYSRVWKQATGVLMYPPLLPKDMHLFLRPDETAQQESGIFRTLPRVLTAMAETAILQTPVVNERTVQIQPEVFSVLSTEWQRVLKQEVALPQFIDNVERQINPKLQ